MHVESFTDPPQKLLGYREWRLRPRDSGAAQAVDVAEGRVHGSGMVVRLEGVTERNHAGLLKGCTIEVARSALPPLKRREYYQADLIGLEVLNLQGKRMGTVRHFVASQGAQIMVVSDGGREVWIPATKRYLHKVELAARRLTVDWPDEN